MSDPERRALSEKFMLRLPDGMRERIKGAAEANHRSMNAEIIARLEATFGKDFDLIPEGVELTAEEEARMSKIMQSFADLLANRQQRGK